MVTTNEPELTCKEIVELVSDYIEGALSPADRRRFEEHLAGCPFCEIYLEQMRHTIDTLGHLPAESIAPAALETLLEHFRKRS